jgi:hypothetical protein
MRRRTTIERSGGRSGGRSGERVAARQRNDTHLTRNPGSTKQHLLQWERS